MAKTAGSDLIVDLRDRVANLEKGMDKFRDGVIEATDTYARSMKSLVEKHAREAKVELKALRSGVDVLGHAATAVQKELQQVRDEHDARLRKLEKLLG